MLLILCPHCGPRNSSEFTYQGEGAARPETEGVSAREWRTYLYERDNTAGPVSEEWFHSAGCRRFLIVERNTTTNEISSVRDRTEA